MSGPSSHAQGPLQAQLTSLRASKPPTQTRLIALGLVATGLAAAGAYYGTDRLRAVRDQEALVTSATSATAGLALRMRGAVEVVQALAAFVGAADEDLDVGNFRAFTSSLHDRHPYVYALEWAPEVRQDALASFLAQARVERPFDVWQPGPDGGRAELMPRERYYPILLMEPEDAALGLDLGFEEDRAALLSKASGATGPVVSPPFQLVEDEATVKSVAVYMPVRNGTLRGLCIVVVRVQSLLTEWRERYLTDGLDAAIADREYELQRFQSKELDQRWSTTLPFGDQLWDITFAVPSGYDGTGFLPGVTATVTTMLGLVLTFVALGVGRVRYLRDQVKRALELGQYVVEKKLGQGGMGAVFLARHAMMKRPTALKLMLSQDPKNIERFEKEVRLTCQLNHPNIIGLYDFGRTEDGLFYYAMEFLPGPDVHSLIVEHGPFPVGRSIHLLHQLALGLREAHAAGLVHRDIKPGNLVVTCLGTQVDVLKILDFGLVKIVEDVPASERGRIMGTPLYLAPEGIVTPNDAGPAMDTYALGCVAYALVSRRPPHIARDVNEILRMQVEDPPMDLEDVCSQRLHPDFIRLVHRCLAKDPKDRPTDDELVAELDRLRSIHPWTEWDAAEWWREHAHLTATPEGEATATRAVTVMSRRPTGLG